MKKTLKLPDWFSGDVERRPIWLPAVEIVYERDGCYYFDGVLGAFLKAEKIPFDIQIALKMSDWTCLARLSYGDQSDEQAGYLPFEIESFALLWNANPPSVHGMSGKKISLFVEPDDKAEYPFVASAGVICNLFLRNGIFRAQPDLEFAEELLKDVA